nr:hypothetical protein [Rhizobium leguminosarum]
MADPTPDRIFLQEKLPGVVQPGIPSNSGRSSGLAQVSRRRVNISPPGSISSRTDAATLSLAQEMDV